MADPLDWYRSALGGDVGTGIPLNLDRTPVPDTGQGTAWSHLQQAPGDILQSVLGLLERGQLGGMNALGLRSPGSDIYRAQIPVEPGLRAAEGAATFATGGLASSLFPAAGALKAGAQYAVPPGTLPGLLADEMGGIRAFHGSPHDFDRFDLSKIGTGEGAQAYGHGLYFAENEGVARGYRDTLAGKAPLKEYAGQPLETSKDWYSLIDRTAPEDWRLAKIIDAAGKQGGIRTALDTFEPHTRNASDGPLWAAAIEKFKEGVGPAAKGHMYEVDINADPKAFLDWDKSLAGQSPDVLTALQKLGQPTGLPAGYRLRQTGSGDYMITDDLGMGVTGKSGMVARGRTPEDALRLYLPTGEEVYQKLAGRALAEAPGATKGYMPPAGFNPQAVASEELRAAGIPGIRYLDQGSRGAGQGSYNYAVGDDSLIQIMRKYGLLPPVVGAGLMGGDNQ